MTAARPRANDSPGVDARKGYPPPFTTRPWPLNGVTAPGKNCFSNSHLGYPSLRQHRSEDHRSQESCPQAYRISFIEQPTLFEFAPHRIILLKP